MIHNNDNDNDNDSNIIIIMAANDKQPSRRSSIDDSTKRSIPVIDPENETGDTEYKRQVHQASAARLRSLATQMSFRLDEGHGHCVYRLGVEDDGCHSLLGYHQIAESAKILECLVARPLNAIVVQRTIIQNEIEIVDKEGDQHNGDGGDDIIMRKMDSNKHGGPSQVEEPSVLGDAHGKITKPSDDAIRLQDFPDRLTRAEIRIQRIETHLLEIPNGQPTSEMAGHGENGSKDAASADANGGNHSNGGASKSATANGATPKTEKLSVGETLSARNIRVAVVGNVDAGKSTLIGTLTTSALDDGRGRSRTAIMKHRHEIESGRTSTATSHLMGFKSTGQPIVGRDQLRANKRKSEDEVARESYRVITLMDLAGHEKYLKTTIHGVSSGFADYALILVNSRQPPTHMTQHHLNLCCSFGIPVIIIFTKIDGCPKHAFKTCREEVTKMLRSPEINKRAFRVSNEDDAMTVMDKLHTLAPMIETSCVTGDGIDLLQKMLFTLPKRRRHENKAKRNFEFLVEDIFNVPGVGSVVSGFVNAGELNVGANCHVFVGPMDDGSFVKTVAKSAHIARINTSHITSGQSACLALALSKEVRKKLRRGMVVLRGSPTATKHFDAEICVLKGDTTTIRKSYQAYVHILNVRQSAFARNIEIVNHHAAGLPPSHAATIDESGEGIVLRPGSRAKVRFEFAQRPEYIRAGMRMLFRDGRVRGVGIITGIPAKVAAA